MRNIEIPFSEFRKYLEGRGVVFEEGEHIATVSWQVDHPDRIVSVGIDQPRIGLALMGKTREEIEEIMKDKGKSYWENAREINKYLEV